MHSCRPAAGGRQLAGVPPTANTESRHQIESARGDVRAERKPRRRTPNSRYIAPPYVMGTRRPIIAPLGMDKGPKSSTPMMVAGSATNRRFPALSQSASARGRGLTRCLMNEFSDFPCMTGGDGCIPAAPGARITIRHVLKNIHPDSEVCCLC